MKLPKRPKKVQKLKIYLLTQMSYKLYARTSFNYDSSSGEKCSTQQLLKVHVHEPRFLNGTKIVTARKKKLII